MAQLMSIVDHQKTISDKLNGCTGVCVVGATAGLSTNPHAMGDRTRSNQIAHYRLAHGKNVLFGN